MSGCAKEEKPTYAGPFETVTLASNTEELSALIWIAEEKGYFLEQGLDLKIVSSLSGVESADKLAKSEADLAMMAEYVVVGTSFENTDLQIIACNGETMILTILAKDNKGSLASVPLFVDAVVEL